MGVVGMGLGLLLYFLREGSPSPEHTLLLPCHPDKVKCQEADEIRAVVEHLVSNKTRTLIGSWPSDHCDLIESLAGITSASVIAWDCPKVERRLETGRTLRLLPKLSTFGTAVVATLKHLRLRPVSFLTLESGLWPQLFLELENQLMKANVTIKEEIFLQDRNYTVGQLVTEMDHLKSRGRVVCILVPVSWSQMGKLVSALSQSLARLPTCLLLVHLSLYPGLSSYDHLLTPLAHSVLALTATSIQGESLERLVNGSLSLMESGTREESLIMEHFTVWDWVTDNSSNSTGNWRPILRLPLSPGKELGLVPLIEHSREWARLKWSPNNVTEACEEDECGEDANGLFSGLMNVYVPPVILVVLLIIITASFFRRFYQQSRLSKGPCKIILTPSDFVFPHVQEVKRVEEGIEAMLCCWLHQLQELGGPEVDKPDLIKGSVGSLKSNIKKSPSLGSISKISSDPRARYNGDLVQLKLIPDNGCNFEIKSKSLDHLMMLHNLRHENLNPMMGCLPDPVRPYLVWEYCSRGSLEDVLMADEIKLDWSFRLSLLTDLVRGMRYLHSSPAKIHGNLTSRNCVIDARWVLKITDYALPSFYESQNIVPVAKKARDLLWSAPEFLRDPVLGAKGTQSGDVYSFGIIIQEVVVRGEPYCMLSLPPEEIIEKLRKPPPLIRPSVSKGAAPPEAINIMRQCWAELPDMRPDFNTIHDLFKTLNHGRKANFVDTMFQMLEKYSNNLEDLIRERTEQLDMEKKKTEQLLNRMLPSYVADKLKVGMPVDPEEFSEVTIYFSDIVGFTTISAYSTPFEVVDLLNDLYTCFDATINAYNVYKVETIGDAYMVVGGLPIRTVDHAQQVATMALDLLHHSGKFRIRHLPFTPLRLRIGLHTGPCCAGVVGLTMPRYCLFGDTVNTASRMESSGSAWRIHISEATKVKLEEGGGGYHIESRGLTELKGKGRVMTYWLLGKDGFDKLLPTPPPLRLDEQLVMYGRTGVMPSQKCSEENIKEEEETAQVVQIAPKPVPSTSSGATHRRTKRPVYQLSLDAGLLAASNDEKVGHKWRGQRQMTFDASPDDTKAECRADANESGTMSPFSASELNISSPGISFVNQSRSTQNLNGKFKKVVDENDLSSQYNHYRCLSPSNGSTIPKAASSRFLKRQYSVDKEDVAENKNRLFKQNSAGAAHDLGRIDEIPLNASSPKFGQTTGYKHRTVQSTASSESLN